MADVTRRHRELAFRAMFQKSYFASDDVEQWLAEGGDYLATCGYVAQALADIEADAENLAKETIAMLENELKESDERFESLRRAAHEMLRQVSKIPGVFDSFNELRSAWKELQAMSLRPNPPAQPCQPSGDEDT